MARAVWSQLPRRLELLVRDGERVDQPSATALDAALDDFQALASFRLPASYREFVHWFGPGALSEWFQICAPIPSPLRRGVAAVYDMKKQHEMLREPDGYWASSVTPEVLQRLLLFASTEGGDWFFWDTTDVRNRRSREYGIYGHAHENSEGEVELIATSFKTFVTEVGLGNRYPFRGGRRKAEWTYWPAWPRKRRR
jgi:hypothetical protein